MVFVVCAEIVLAEARFSRHQWLILYLTGAVVGHVAGEVFQPLDGGASVAYFGLLDGLAGLIITGEQRAPIQLRGMAFTALPAALIDTAFTDIQGLPLLAGLAVVWAWQRWPAKKPPGANSVIPSANSVCE